MKSSTLRVPAAWKLRAHLPCPFLYPDGWLPNKIIRLVAALVVVLLTHLAQAQQRDGIDLFREDGAARLAANTSPVAAQLRHSRALSLEVRALDAALAPARRGAEVVLVLPLPDGRSARFGVREASVMDAATAARFPELRTYAGRGLDDPDASARLDITPYGFHGQILSGALGAVYLEPARPGDVAHYLSFFRADVDRSASLTAAPACVWQPGLDAGAPARTGGAAGPVRRTLLAIGTNLRTYRLAVAATAEYTANRGGTVASAQAAILTTVNRVTGVYERELAVRLLLVANNGSLIYTNAGTDPYTNNSPSSLVSQNQSNLTSVLGTAGFDIGHVFSTAGGGLAYVGVVCNASLKAAGETGISNPVGDAFDIDYVAHEIGHQFGGNHTFSSSQGSCGGNGNPNTAYEPGSGSTIMAYAGICSGDNLQARSDPYFHVVSYEEIENYLATTSCGAVASTGNSVPSVSLPPGGKTLPISTPFKLTATGTDADGDALTFCWEEWDLAQNGTPPLFRSFLPAASPTRYFPRLSDLLAGTTTIGETLPTTTRPLNFRVTVRDAHSGLQGVVGGINSSPVLGLSASVAAGPFVVTAPNTAVTWAAGSSQTVTWNVANTTAAPVSSAIVNIRLSTDGGLTYPTVLATSTPNDGSENVTVPSLATTQARIMVEAADNYFFDISNTNFTISGAVAGPTLSSLSPATGPVGTSVTITGTNLTGATAVSFNGTAATFTVNSGTQVTATVPAGATTGNVTVAAPGGTSNGLLFTLTVPVPTLSSLSPATGTAGTTVMITGTNLTGATSVTFNGITATFTVTSNTQIMTSVPPGASTGNVVVTTPGGPSNGLAFTVTAPLPTLSSLSPASGPAGTAVAITGTNLAGATSVSFNGMAAAFTVNSATQITATVPAGATTGNVTVTTPAGASNGLLFTVTIPAPVISGLSPTSGPVGTAVVITGTSFTGATAVSFNGTAATFTVNSGTQVTATVPAGATTGNVTVTTPGGTSNTAAFTVLPGAPAISSLSPTSGTPGTSVTITGTNLAGATSVSFNGTAAAFTVNSATQLTATVPTGATSGNVTVTTPGGTSNGLAFTVTVPASTISSLSPASGPVGTSVVITGLNFTGATAVSFNGTVATFTVNSGTQITATVPAGATTGSVVVTAPGGTSNGVAFTVIPPAPVLSSLSPATGPVGTSVTIAGTNLAGATSVSFNGTAATFTVNSGTQLTATVPAGASTGSVTVTTPGGTSNGLAFTVAAPAPSLSSLSPATGPVGTSVVITGTGFTGATSVSFNGTAAAFTVNSATQLTATVPAGATTGNVTVAAPGGTSNGLPFAVLPPAPTLTNLSPSSGPLGTSVTLTGTSLTGTTSVSFNGSSASFVVNSATQLTATVPAGASTGLVTVTTPGGSSNGITFSVTAPVPVLSSLSPTSGPAGTSVTIIGTGLTGTTAVSFNGLAAPFAVVNAGTITATVPAGATTGLVTVTTPGGTSNGLAFSVTIPASTITALSPTSGPVGTTVIITGTNLTGATGVTFNGVSAALVVNSATQLTTTVPGGATTGSVVVHTPGGPSNGILFTVVPAAPTLTGISPNSSPVGTTVIITGTNLTGTTAVSFNGTGATFTVNSATQLTALVPTGATSGPVTVATLGGLSNAVGFTVAVPTSTITTLSPSSGGIGTTVVITGTNFTGAGSVTFNGVSAPFTLNSPTQITTVVPFGATFGPVVVTVSGSSNGLIFTVIPPLPLILSFAPMGGPVGVVVTITGTDFVGTTAVAFNGVSAVFTFVSGTVLTATVPAGATSGPITVTTAGGTGTSSTSFSVFTPILPSLTVSTVQVIPPGAYNDITITGTGEGTLGGAVSVVGTFTVQADGIFDDGCQLLTGSGSFTLAAGATLRTCSPGGISASGATGSIQVTGIRTFSPDASYVYDGTVAQLTGSGLPANVRNLTVNNAPGVSLTQDLALARVLTLQAGNLSLGASNLLLLSNAAGTAMVVNRGSGRVQPTGTGTGRATMQRFITLDPAQPYTGPGYRHYSPPVANTTVADLAVPGLYAPLANPAYNALPTPALPLAQFPNVFDYQESRITPAFPDFVTGFRSPTSPSDALVPTAGYTVNIAPAATVDLSGLLNTGPLTTGPLTRGATANSGWQFLGNPYPAPLDWAVVEATPGALPTGLGAAIYVFEPTSQYGGFYRSYVGGVGTGGFAGVLPAMQGFFVRATQAVPGGFTFQDLFRVTTYQNPPFRRQTAGADPRPRLRLTLSPTAGPVGLLDETLVYFDPAATATGTDAAFDAPKLPNSNQLGLASRMPGPPASEVLAINGLPPALLAAGTRLPLELALPAAGPYQLHTTELANFDPALPLALLDLATGTRTDLRLVPTYAFTAAQAGALVGRFELLLGRTATATTGRVPASAFRVWPNPVASGEARLHIALASNAPAATAVLRTILGQPVRTQALHNGTTELPTNGLATGTYLLTVQVPGEPGVTQRVLVE
ncbi:IPT/TIG domain-containing protein [Hymenobacter sp. UYCo722]|uniref:IPT/TIG domain-containing protein n=1 Tax=Hymenobacter sp. UYCo722 TaxID=3156335 RepID=UPI003394C08D